MTQCPFKDEELQQAKEDFAYEWFVEQKSAAFGDPNPIKAALRLWNEGNGSVGKAMWVGVASGWTEDDEVKNIVKGLYEQAEAEEFEYRQSLAEKLNTPEYKAQMRHKIIENMVTVMESVSAKASEKVQAADRISKLLALDEKPVLDDETHKDHTINVIHHRLRPMEGDQFDDYARGQQAQLQRKLVELTADDATVLN